MSFPRYPAYKDSGVPFLGEVPAHWEMTKLKRVVPADRGITYGIVQAGPHVPDGVPYIRPADMTDESGVAEPQDIQRTTREIASIYTRSMVREGDLICSIGPSFGKVMQVPAWLDGANLTQGTARVSINKSHSNRFIFWILRSKPTNAQWESSIGGATFRALNLGPLAETLLAAPPLGEQEAIAAFLDRETSAIDALVAEQRRLIDLLQEKRQAVISAAVTKGLNPDVPMKPSGIPWLGDVPAHWETRPISRMADWNHGIFIDGDWIESKDLSDCGIRYLTSGNVGDGEYKEQGTGYISQETFAALKCTEVFPGDILISRLNLPAGRACIVPDLGERIVTCVDNVIFRPAALFDRRYVVFCLSSKQYFAHTELLARGATMQRLSRSVLGNIRCCMPPLEEQRAIVAHLTFQLAAIDRLSAEAQQTLSLLSERRSALITAAVTGQIDVRGHVTKRSA